MTSRIEYTPQMTASSNLLDGEESATNSTSAQGSKKDQKGSSKQCRRELIGLAGSMPEYGNQKDWPSAASQLERGVSKSGAAYQVLRQEEKVRREKSLAAAQQEMSGLTPIKIPESRKVLTQAQKEVSKEKSSPLIAMTASTIQESLQVHAINTRYTIEPPLLLIGNLATLQEVVKFSSANRPEINRCLSETSCYPNLQEGRSLVLLCDRGIDDRVFGVYSREQIDLVRKSPCCLSTELQVMEIPEKLESVLLQDVKKDES